MPTDYVPPLGLLRVVSVEDPALRVLDVLGPKNVEGMLFDRTLRYAETRDESLLEFYPGQTPTWYTLAPIEREDFFGHVEHGTRLADRWERALQCALVKVENLVQADGTIRPVPWEPLRTPVPGMERGVVRPDELRKFLPTPGVLYELGKLAYDRAHLHPLAQSVCVPPPGSFDRIAARLRVVERRAEMSGSQAPTAIAQSFAGSTGATAPESIT